MAVYDDPRQAFLHVYLAAMIDAEGSIMILKGHPPKDCVNPKYVPQVSVGMTNKEVVQMFSDTFGGNVYEESVPDRRTMYRWRTAGSKSVLKVLTILSPYLIVKREHAHLLMDFCNSANWKARFFPPLRPCLKCNQEKQMKGHGLCGACYMYEKRHGTLEKWLGGSTSPLFMPVRELQRREEAFQKMRQLNAVGAAAQTEQERSREAEATVGTHAKA